MSGWSRPLVLQRVLLATNAALIAIVVGAPAIASPGEVVLFRSYS